MLQFHGERDWVVWPHSGRRLHRSLPAGVAAAPLVLVAAAGHEDAFDAAAVRESLSALLRTLDTP